MNLSELRDKFRADTGDTVSPYFWSNESVARYLSEAETEAAIRAKLIHHTEELDVVAGESSIEMPVGMFDIQYAELRATDGTSYEIRGATRRDLDIAKPGWRTTTERPEHYIHDDKSLILSALPDASYTLYIEGYRTPAAPMEDDEDEPEINSIHHDGLLQWAFKLAYSVPDADTFNPGKAKDAEEAFDRMFGRRPDADIRRRQNANRPHRNRVHL